MNAKVTGILAVVTLVAVVTAIQVSQRAPAPKPVNESSAFFPNLLSKLSELDAINIQTNNAQFQILKQGESWGLQEKAGYPVPAEKIAAVLNGMAGLIKLEAKTDKPELYSRLALEEIEKAGADTIQVRLKQGQSEFASLLIGKSKPAKTDTGLSEIYVRKPGEAQSWLVLGNLRLETDPLAWLDKTIFQLAPERVQAVTLARSQEKLMRIFKEKAEDTAFQLAELPEKATLENHVLDSLGRALANLTLEDVVKAEGFSFPAEATELQFSSFDGLQITLRVGEQAGKHYATLKAAAKAELIAATPEPAKTAAPADQAPADASKPAADKPAASPADKLAAAEKEAADLNAKFSPWVYVLPSYQVNNLLPKATDLYKLADATAQPGTPTQGEVSLPGASPLDILNNLGKP